MAARKAVLLSGRQRAHPQRSMVILGTFDGVHRGHQRLLRRFVATAKRRRLAPCAVFFDVPPRFYFSPPSAPSLLTTPAERAGLLLRLGVPEVRFLKFDRRLSELSHVRFFKHYLLERLRCRGLVVGPDFAFGKDRLGDIHWLEKASAGAGVHLEVLPLATDDGQKISSTRIRHLLQGGEVEDAARLLGRSYALEGTVIRGRGAGRKLGAPTANLRVDAGKLLPRGVYKVRASTCEWGRMKNGVCNIGVRPTFGGKSRVHVEVHIPGFSGGLYGKSLRIELVRKIRDERRFPSLHALKAQIQKDIDASRR